MNDPNERFPHGGNLKEMAERVGCSEEDILDFSANINPVGFPEWLRPLISSQVSRLRHYPDIRYKTLKEALSKRHQVNEDEVTLGNGSSEILFALPGALNIQQGLLPIPSFADYEKVLLWQNIPYKYFSLKEENNFELDYKKLETCLAESDQRPGMLFLGHPNNPNGSLLDTQKVSSLAPKFPHWYFVIDEAFVDFADQVDSWKENRPQNIILLNSLTKILAIPGLRIGFALAHSEVTTSLNKRIPPWSVNTLAAAVAEKAMEDESFFFETKKKVRAWREVLTENLESLANKGKLKLKIFPSEANFLLIKLNSTSLGAKELARQLLSKYRISIRSCDSYPGLNDSYFRVAIRTPEENEKLLMALEDLLECPTPTPNSNSNSKKSPRRAAALMLQGTGSNVGKSILTAALCRILKQDGINVAPFKAQNMALNSYVTSDGGEIGRAQALQAQAAQIVADTRMNPVLLKPTSDKGSQVIIHGKPVAHMDFRDYTVYKAKAFLEVQSSYDSLSSEYQAIILEGAGSAAEVNLKKNDIVNMRMAQYARAKVLLVGNIDYGGIFGAFVGTMETLAEWERNLVAGFIINRFRGIKDLLQPGVQYLEDHSGKKVFGIVPYLKNLGLPEEDSMEFKSGNLSDETPLSGRIDIALIDMPRISNHTDVDALRVEKDVRVRLVRKPQDLLLNVNRPDVVIIGGSKNVSADLQYLKESGIAERLLTLSEDGKTEIVGICGGYQMLGERLLDPFHVETDQEISEGLGLLPLVTQLEKEKMLAQCQGLHLSSGKMVKGYEIHHGTSHATSDVIEIVVERSDGLQLGYGNKEQTIWGTYMHGIFDDDEFRRWFIDKIRIRKGKTPLEKVQSQYDLEKGLDLLAKNVRESLDMNRLYQLMRI